LLLVGEISGCLVSDFRMTSNAIVKHLDVFKGNLPGLPTSGEAVVMSNSVQYFLQTARIFTRGLSNNSHTTSGRELFSQMLKFTKSGKFNALFDTQ